MRLATDTFKQGLRSRPNEAPRFYAFPYETSIAVAQHYGGGIGVACRFSFFVAAGVIGIECGDNFAYACKNSCIRMHNGYDDS
ncbi:hypothetical protein FB008_101359 [Sinorhizobium medicae]|nr:hypothetical protein FB008_101359 [Sinorhizobium medicae]